MYYRHFIQFCDLVFTAFVVESLLKTPYLLFFFSLSSSTVNFLVFVLIDFGDISISATV